MATTTTLTEQTPEGEIVTILPETDSESSVPLAGGGGGYWGDLSDRAVDRITNIGITTYAQLTSWLTTNPYGTSDVGRVITAELRVWAHGQGLIASVAVPEGTPEP